MNLTVTEGAIGTTGTARIAGDADCYGAPELRRSLMRLDDAGHADILVDLTACEFLDATGLGVLVGALKRARAKGGSVVIACDREEILKIFRTTGMVKVFRVCGTREEAIEALR